MSRQTGQLKTLLTTALAAAALNFGGCATAPPPAYTIASPNPPQLTRELTADWGLLAILPGGFWRSDSPHYNWVIEYYWASDGSLASRSWEPRSGGSQFMGHARYVRNGPGRFEREMFIDGSHEPASSWPLQLRAGGVLREQIPSAGTVSVIDWTPVSQDSFVRAGADSDGAGAETWVRLTRAEMQSYWTEARARNDAIYAPITEQANRRLAQARRESDAQRQAFWNTLTQGLVAAVNTYVEASNQASSGPTPYYRETQPSPSSPATSSGRSASWGGTTQPTSPDSVSGSGSAGSQDSGRVIPIQFYYTIPMRPLDSDTRNRVCRSNIVALSDRVDQDSQASRQQAMAIAGRYRASFLEKCNRLGTTYDVGNLQLTIHGMNTRGTESFVNPSHPSDYRVTLP